MKISLYNSFDDYGGAAKSSYRLFKALNKIDDLNVNFIVQTKSIDEKNISLKGHSRLKRIYDKLANIMDKKILNLLYPSRGEFPWSLDILPRFNNNDIREIEIIHLNWICNGFLSIKDISHYKKPIVWTLHDSWAFTGGCHIPLDCNGYSKWCGNCPQLHSNSQKDISHRTLIKKNKYWNDLNLTIVTPSNWLADCARRSVLFSGRPIHVIPNGLDINVFKPINKGAAKEIWNMSSAKKYILFGAMSSTKDKNKGFHLLIPALRNLFDTGVKREDIEIIAFGASYSDLDELADIKIRYVGNLKDEVSLASLYSAADVFVAPSLSENLPNTVMESLACGTPVVAFNIGGIPDLIDHGKNGYLAKPYEEEDLSEGIRWVLENQNRWNDLSFNCREKVLREFDISIITEKYQELYKKILNEAKI